MRERLAPVAKSLIAPLPPLTGGTGRKGNVKSEIEGVSNVR